MDIEVPASAPSVPAPVDLPPMSDLGAVKDLLLKDEAPESVETKPEATEEAPTEPEAVEGEPVEETAPVEAATSAKKPTALARLKAEHQATQQLLSQSQDKYRDAMLVANDWYNRAQALQQHYEAALTAAGVKVDPRDAELLRVKMQVQSQELITKGKEASEQQKHDDAIVQQKLAYQAAFTEEATALGAKHNISPKSILLAYANAHDAGFTDMTMEQAAANLVATVRNTPARQQLAVNRSAPQTIKPGKSASPSYGADRDGMKAYLSSLEG